MMSEPSEYQVGQRWQLNSGVPQFENTLVIGHVEEACPESDRPETKYEGYVRYNTSSGLWTPPGKDGVVLGFTAETLRENVTWLVETGVELPEWWRYGAPPEDGQSGCSVFECGLDIAETLAFLLQGRWQHSEYRRQRDETIQRHRALFAQPHRKLPARRSSPETFWQRLCRFGRDRPEVAVGSVRDSWERIAAWIDEYAGRGLFRLNGGVPLKAIEHFEKEIGARLPDDFRESLQIHELDRDPECWISSFGNFQTLEQILKQWKMYCEWQKNEGYGIGDDWRTNDIVGPIKPVFWNPLRIYISDNSGDHLTIDLDPPPDGRRGQLVKHSHEVGPKSVVASSWSEFLRQLADDLEAGKYVYFEDELALERLTDDT